MLEGSVDSMVGMTLLWSIVKASSCGGIVRIEAGVSQLCQSDSRIRAI